MRRSPGQTNRVARDLRGCNECLSELESYVNQWQSPWMAFSYGGRTETWKLHKALSKSTVTTKTTFPSPMDNETLYQRCN